MASRGRLILLQIGDGLSPETFSTVGGLRSRGAAINNELIDITNSESQDYRELKQGGYGTRTCSISGAGVFLNDAVIRAFEDAAYLRSVLTLRVVFENQDYIEGDFKVVNFTYSGESNGAQTYSLSIESAAAFWLVRYTPPVPPVLVPDWTSVLTYSFYSETAASSSQFGRYLAISGDGNYIVSSDPVGFFDGNDQGVVTVHVRGVGGWSQQQVLNPGDLPNGNSNESERVAINDDGDIVAVGYYYSGVPTERVYMWTRSGTTWTRVQTINRPTANTGFGIQVALSGDGSTLVVAAPYTTESGFTEAGRLYVYDRSGGVWSLTAQLVAPSLQTSMRLGFGLAISHQGLIIAGSAPEFDDPAFDSGAVFIWEKVGSTWVSRSRIHPSDPATQDYFGAAAPQGGQALALSRDGTYLIAGAPRKTNVASNDGAAYIFKRSGDTWMQQQKLVGSLAGLTDLFANSVVFDREANYAFITSPQEDSIALNGGIGYIYQRSGDTWSELRTIYPSGLGSDERFGWSITASESGRIACASYNKANGIGGTGVGYVFEANMV